MKLVKLLSITVLFNFLSIHLIAQNPTFLWAKNFGGITQSTSNAIATDASGNVFTSGLFTGTVDFDPGAGTEILTASTFEDMYIQKLDASGNFLWVKQIIPMFLFNIFSVSTDETGNIYATGYFAGTVDFDPGIAEANLTSNTNFDVFILKLDANGNFLWAKSVGGIGGDNGYSITNDVAGNVYITGNFENVVDFDPGIGVTNLTSFAGGASNIFILKLNTEGDFLWVKQMGGANPSNGVSITIDAFGNILSTGSFAGTVDLDPGAATASFTTVNNDSYLQKLDSNGNFLWAKQIGGTNGSSIYVTDIATDAFGNVYTTGLFEGVIDFDPGAVVENFTSVGFNDVFIQKLDINGNLLWAKHMGGTSGEYGNSINIDKNNNVYTTGTFYGTVDFDPSEGVANLISINKPNMFIQKLSESGDFIWAKQTSGKDSRTFGISTAIDANGNIFTTGTFSGTGDFDPGVETANLTSNGAGDIYIQKLYECQNTFTTDTQTACGSYTWINNVTYSASNDSATYILSNARGCDSVITLNLTINTAIDLTTTIVGNTITANSTNATYQWLDCDNNYSILPNETNQSFTATTIGNYAVEITNNECSDTSSCVTISTIGINTNYQINKFVVFPDPTEGDFFIKFETIQQDLSVRIMSISGRIIETRFFQNTDFIHMKLDHPAGIYLVEILNEANSKTVTRLIKK